MNILRLWKAQKISLQKHKKSSFFSMDNNEKQRVIEVFKPKILGIRNYKSLKKEFFVDDFTNLQVLDNFMEEVSCGESDITPAGKAFLEKYYGLNKLPDLIVNELYKNNSYFHKNRVSSNVLCLETPMETITFIEQARGNIDKDNYTLREDLLPPEDITPPILEERK